MSRSVFNEQTATLSMARHWPAMVPKGGLLVLQLLQIERNESMRRPCVVSKSNADWCRVGETMSFCLTCTNDKGCQQLPVVKVRRVVTGAAPIEPDQGCCILGIHPVRQCQQTTGCCHYEFFFLPHEKKSERQKKDSTKPPFPETERGNVWTTNRRTYVEWRNTDIYQSSPR